MKRKLLLISLGVVAILLGLYVTLNLWIGSAVNSNIEMVQEKYPGNAEDALISFLLDETNYPIDRTHIAIWTLGQLHSQKALPILESMYKDDPRGESCYGNHYSKLCQYEIYKAITKIKEKQLISGINKK